MKEEKSIRGLFWDYLNNTDFYLARRHHMKLIDDALLEVSKRIAESKKIN